MSLKDILTIEEVLIAFQKERIRIDEAIFAIKRIVPLDIKNLITKEIAEANANGESTSRLTRINNLIK
jgi:hypothetical protein